MFYIRRIIYNFYKTEQCRITINGLRKKYQILVGVVQDSLRKKLDFGGRALKIRKKI